MDALAERLEAERARSYVSRPAAEAAFEELLAGTAPMGLFIAGPGGIGKTTLLAELARMAEQRGWATRQLDLAELPARPSVVADAFEAIDGRTCVLLDAFEEHASLERRYLGEWLGGLPPESRLVIAGRRAPDPALLRRTGWRPMLRTHLLEPMSTHQASTLLRRHGVDEEGVASRVQAGRGHPLTLARLAELDFLPPGEVTDAWLTETLLGSLATTQERAVLALALADGCDRALLAALVDTADIEALEQWLNTQPFVALGRSGWSLHRCYADAAVRQARRAAPDVYRQMILAGAEHLAGQLTVEQDRGVRRAVLRRAFAMTRQQAPAVETLPRTTRGRFGWDSADDDDDRADILAAVERHEGPESAAVVAHHLARDSRRVSVLRDGDGVARGFLSELDGEGLSAADRRVDPSIAQLEEREGPAILVRHWMCFEHHQTPCPVSSAVLREFVANAYERSDLRHHLVVDPANETAGADQWVAQGTVAVFDGAAFEEDGRSVRIVGWDLRQRPFPERLRHVIGLHVGEPVASRRAEPRTAVTSIDDLEEEVGQLLRSFHDDERLAQSPLADRLSTPASDVLGRARGLREELRAVADRLPATARVDAPGELIARAYFVSPVPKQLRVAADLGMAYSTFRRHLADARRALTRHLEREWSEKDPSPQR